MRGAALPSFRAFLVPGSPMPTWIAKTERVGFSLLERERDGLPAIRASKSIETVSASKRKRRNGETCKCQPIG